MHQRLKHTGDLLQIDKNQFMKIPLFVADEKSQKQLSSQVDAIIAAKQKIQDTSQLEGEIDVLVYALYKLTPEEICVIEATN